MKLWLKGNSPNVGLQGEDSEITYDLLQIVLSIVQAHDVISTLTGREGSVH